MMIAWLRGYAEHTTAGLPDNLSLYRPVFHLNALWLAAFGVVALTLG